MVQFSEGDRVRIDIPDESDPDYGPYHRTHGEVISTLSDDAEVVTGNEVDSELYRVSLENGETGDFRGRDLRPPFEQ
jgi:hypothetical protein